MRIAADETERCGGGQQQTQAEGEQLQGHEMCYPLKTHLNRFPLSSFKLRVAQQQSAHLSINVFKVHKVFAIETSMFTCHC